MALKKITIKDKVYFVDNQNNLLFTFSEVGNARKRYQREKIKKSTS